MSIDFHASSPRLRALAAGVRGDVPSLMIGGPGQAKTAKLTALGKAWGYHVEVVAASNRQDVDYMGLPVEVDGRVVYSPLDWAERAADAEKAMIFFGELTTSSPTQQKAFLRAAQEREVGSIQLPKSVRIIGDANPAQQAVDGWELEGPVANRFFHGLWHFDADEWRTGMLMGFDTLRYPTMESMLGKGSDRDRLNAKIRVTTFTSFKPDLLCPAMPADPVLAGRGWPSPRSWTNTAAMLGELDPGDSEAAKIIIEGCVGTDAMRDFISWEATADLYDPAEVIKDPSIVDWKNARADRLFAVIYSVAALAIASDDASTASCRRWEAALAVMTACARVKADIATPGARMLLNARPDGARLTAADQKVFGDLFRRMGRWADAA